MRAYARTIISAPPNREYLPPPMQDDYNSHMRTWELCQTVKVTRKNVEILSNLVVIGLVHKVGTSLGTLLETMKLILLGFQYTRIPVSIFVL